MTTIVVECSVCLVRRARVGWHPGRKWIQIRAPAFELGAHRHRWRTVRSAVAGGA